MHGRGHGPRNGARSTQPWITPATTCTPRERPTVPQPHHTVSTHTHLCARDTAAVADFIECKIVTENLCRLKAPCSNTRPHKTHAKQSLESTTTQGKSACSVATPPAHAVCSVCRRPTAARARSLRPACRASSRCRNRARLRHGSSLCGLCSLASSLCVEDRVGGVVVPLNAAARKDGS